MTKLILILSLSISFNLFAGSGHSHGKPKMHSHGGAPAHAHQEKKIDREDAVAFAKKEVVGLIKKGKIHKSWEASSKTTVEQKVFNSRPEYLVTFYNEKGRKAKKLYIFLKMNGDFIAANFTGK